MLRSTIRPPEFSIQHRLPFNQPSTCSLQRMSEVTPLAQKKLLLVSLTFSGISIVGILNTSQHPDSHPALFAFSLTWIINVVVFEMTRNYWLSADPKRFRFEGWEREGRIYRWVGVDAFRWVLLRTPLSWLSPTLKLAPHRSGMERLLKELNCAEGIHRVGGVVTICVACGYILAGYRAGLYIALVALLLHAYPVMLQRRNRGLVLKLAHRLEVHRRAARP